jgi:hypothetical protein
VQIITLATENITAPIHLGCLYTCRTKQCIKLRCTLFIRNQALGRGSTRRTRAALQPSSCTFWGKGQTRKTRAALQPSSCLMGRVGEGGGNEKNASNAPAELLFHGKGGGRDRAQNSRLVCRCITTGVT